MLRTLALIGMLLLTAVGCAQSPSPEAREPLDSSFVPDRSTWPAPPTIPDDFSWSGRYQVPDLGIETQFSWFGADGDFQMIAGEDGEPVHFTNLIVDGQLYTLTYAWPGVPRTPCSHVGAFTLDELNAGFAEASYVGAETLHRESDFLVNHFRSVGVLDLTGEGVDDLPLRVPLMAGDIYVDADDSSCIRQLLHFGVQNLYDPNLDEWILIDSTDEEPRTIALPAECV